MGGRRRERGRRASEEIYEGRIGREQQRKKRIRVVVEHGHEQLSEGSSKENLIFEHKEDDEIDNRVDGSSQCNQIRLK